MPEVTQAKKPAGWAMVSLADIVDVINDYWDRDATIPERLVAGEHIDEGDMRIHRWGMTDDDLIPPTFNRRFQKGDALLHSRNIDKVAQPDFGGITGEKIFILRSKDKATLLQELVPYLVASDDFRQYAESRWAGSTNKFLNKTPLMQYEFALPPLEEQRRIVEVLAATESSFASIGALSTSCDSLLRSAVDHVMSRFITYRCAIGDLVEEGVIHRPQDGNHGELHPKSSQYTADGIPFLMVSDVSDGEVRLDTCKFLPQSVTDGLRIGFALEGDVLLTHKATLGQVGILRGLKTPYAMLTPQVTYYRVSDVERLLPEFLAFALSSSDFFRQMKSYGRQSTRDAVSITTQRKLIIPVPPVAIQEKAVIKLNAIRSAKKSCRLRIDASAAHRRAISEHMLGQEA